MRLVRFEHAGALILDAVLSEASDNDDARAHVRMLARDAFDKDDHAFIAVLSEFVMPMLQAIGPSAYGARVLPALRRSASNSDPDVSLAAPRKNWVNDGNHERN